MNNFRYKLCIAMGPLGAVLLFTGLWPAMQFLPPLDPLMGAADVAAVYRANQTGILVGAILIMLGTSLLIPFFAVISAQMKRIEGRSSPLAYTQMLTGMFGVVPVFMAAVIFSAAAFRPDRADELIRAFSDLGFLSLTIASLPGTVQFGSIGLAALADKRSEPVFPRWFGYICLWTAILYIPGCLVALFKVGPFTWRGALGFWLIAILLGIWINIMVWVLLRAGKQIDEPDGA